jgi:predicted MFS family arabinose efflux permease
LPGVRQVLKLAAYRRLLAAYTLNELAWSVGSVALAVLVYRRTGSAIGAMGFFLCSQFVPALIAPALVARLDRLAPRTVLPALYSFEALAFAALAIVAHRFDIAPVLVLALLDGIVAVTARALARAATVSVLTPARLLPEGNALTNGVFSVCFMLGPALGGLVVATRGTVAALVVNSVLFVLIAVTLATARTLPEAPEDSDPAAGRLRAALAYVRDRPPIRDLLSLQAVGVAFYTISTPVVVVLAAHTLRKGAGGYGALLSAWGAGAVVGSAAYARWHARPVWALVGAGAAALAAGFLVMAATSSIVVAAAGAALAGVGNGVEAVSIRTALQELAEPRWIARVMGLQESIMQAVPGVGIVLGGVITALASTRAALAVAGAGALAIVAASWIVLRPRAPAGTETLA